MTQPTDDQLAAAAQKARADHETAREIAARLLAPPDPVDILAGVIADRGDVADERDELQAKCDALTAERDDLRAGLSEIACCFTSDSMDHVLSAQTIVFAIADLNTRVADLSSFLSTAEEYAETQRTAAADLRDALDRVAAAVGVESDSTGAIVADRVIAVLRAKAEAFSSATIGDDGKPVWGKNPFGAYLIHRGCCARVSGSGWEVFDPATGARTTGLLSGDDGAEAAWAEIKRLTGGGQ